MKNSVLTKDGVKVEKRSNKYKGHIFYDEKGGSYQCLGFYPKFDECVYLDLQTGKHVVGCMDGFYFSNPIKKKAEGGNVEVGNNVEIELSSGKIIIGKLEKQNPIKIRTDATSVQVIPNALIKSIKKFAKGGAVDKGNFVSRFKEGQQVEVDEAYLNDEVNEGNDTSKYAVVLREPTDAEELVMIMYESGVADYVGQEWLEPIIDIPRNQMKQKLAKGGAIKRIKDEDIKVGAKFQLINGEVIEIKRLFIENTDEDWVEFTRFGKSEEGRVKSLRIFFNNWGGQPIKYAKGGNIGTLNYSIGGL
jgi:hypothetical protein